MAIAINEPRLDMEKIPGIAIPFPRLNGADDLVRYKLLGEFYRRPDDKDVSKYLQPPKSRNRLFFSATQDYAQLMVDPTATAVITEGELKTIAGAVRTPEYFWIGVTGIWNWKKRTDDDASLPIKDLFAIEWRGRIVLLAFDNDPARNPSVQQSREMLRTFLWEQGAIVHTVDIPCEGTTKGAVDDYLLAHGAKALRKLLHQAANVAPTDLASEQQTPHDLWTDVDVAPPLRLGLLPQTLEAFAFSSQLTLDPTALGYASLAVCAGAASSQLQVIVEGLWREQARLWAALYGDASAGKSPVIKLAYLPVSTLVAERLEGWEAERGVWVRAKEAREHDKNAPDPGPEPKPPTRLITHDTTPAALSEILKDNPHGILIVNDEFSTVLSSMDNERDRRGAAERGPMLKLYDGGRNEVDRVQRGMVIVKNWSASIVGGVTTSKLLNVAKHGVPDGMLARCMLIQTAALPPNESLGEPQDAQFKAYEAIVHALIKHRPNDRVDVNLTPEAKALMGAAKKKWQQLARDVAGELPRHAERIGKATGQAAGRVASHGHRGLSTSGEAVEVRTGRRPGSQWTDVTGDQMRRAIALLDLQIQHDLVFYRSLTAASASPAMELARQVARWILREVEGSFTQQKVNRAVHAWQHTTDDRIKRDALAILVDLNWIGPSAKDWYEYGGKISRGVVFAVNPLVHELFVARAEAARRECEAVMLKIATDTARAKGRP